MKKILIILVILLFPFALFASPETWIGFGVSTGHETPSLDFKTELKKNNSLIQNNLYNNGDFRYFGTVGINYELLFFPYAPIKVGIHCSGNTNFIVSYDGIGYKSHNFDAVQDLNLGLAYNQFFGNNGFYTDLTFNYVWYSIAGSNYHNSKLKPEYTKFSEYGIYIDLGYITVLDNLYFKGGFSYKHALSNKSSNSWAFNIQLKSGIYF